MECICREIGALENANTESCELTWENDYLPLCQEHLVGVDRLVKNSDGSEEMRKVMLADIQALQQQVEDTLLGL